MQASLKARQTVARLIESQSQRPKAAVPTAQLSVTSNTLTHVEPKQGLDLHQTPDPGVFKNTSNGRSGVIPEGAREALRSYDEPSRLLAHDPLLRMAIESWGIRKPGILYNAIKDPRIGYEGLRAIVQDIAQRRDVKNPGGYLVGWIAKVAPRSAGAYS